MQVNVLTHTTTVTPNSKQLAVINKLKQLHKAQDQRELDVDNMKDATAEQVIGLKEEVESGNNHVESKVKRNSCDVNVEETNDSLYVFLCLRDHFRLLHFREFSWKWNSTPFQLCVWLQMSMEFELVGIHRIF